MKSPFRERLDAKLLFDRAAGRKNLARTLGTCNIFGTATPGRQQLGAFVNWIRNYKRQIAIYTAFVSLAAVMAPNPLWLAQQGLDSSWAVGLHLATRGLSTSGWNVIFPYGPLAFLFYPMPLQDNLWILSVVFVYAINFLFYVSIAAFVIRTQNL